MSRVDEALRRASRGSRTDLPDKTSGPVKVPAGQASLERYPTEGRSGIGSRPHLDARPAPDNVRVAVPSVPAAPPVPSVPVPIRPGAAGRRLSAFDPSLDGKIVVTADASPAAIEQYDRLATKLVRCQVERGTRTVMVASALPREGRTLTAANLALALSEHHQKQVLLVDADLASPSIHTIFRVSNVMGLGDSLRAGRTQMPVIDVSARLAVLPAGPADPDPMEVLVSNRMRDFLREARPHFDFIVLDTPPVSTLTDATCWRGWPTPSCLLYRPRRRRDRRSKARSRISGPTACWGSCSTGREAPRSRPRAARHPQRLPLASPDPNEHSWLTELRGPAGPVWNLPDDCALLKHRRLRVPRRSRQPVEPLRRSRALRPFRLFLPRQAGGQPDKIRRHQVIEDEVQVLDRTVVALRRRDMNPDVGEVTELPAVEAGQTDGNPAVIVGVFHSRHDVRRVAAR